MRTLVREIEEWRGKDHAEALLARTYLAAVESTAGNPREGLRILEEVQPKLDETFGRRHPASIIALHNLGSDAGQLGQFDKARVYLDEAMERGMNKSHGPEWEAGVLQWEGFEDIYDKHIENLEVDELSRRAALYLRVGLPEQARLTYQAAYDAQRRVYGERHWQTPYAAVAAAAAPAFVGRYTESEQRLTDLLQAHSGDDGEMEDPAVGLEILWGLARCRKGLGDRVGARSLIERSLTICRDNFESEDCAWYQAALSSLDGDREATFDSMRQALEQLAVATYSPERDILFDWLWDDSEFRGIIESTRHPYLIR
jgi:tetratricopeptide (TPR) repeat protein